MADSTIPSTNTPVIKGSQVAEAPPPIEVAKPTPLPKEPPLPQKSQDELERVRELILGPDAIQRFGKAEADRLREIIFGAHMQEYDRRFADIRREMERVSGDLRVVQDNVVEFERTQTKQLETVEQETRQTDDDLWREVNRLRAQEATIQQLITQVRQLEILSQNLVNRNDELQKMLAQQERDLRALKGTVNEYRDQNERKFDGVKRETRLGLDDLRVELRRLVDRLDNQKTDRKALASMLIEIAARLETGSSVTGLLKELPTPE
jgi:chromosome segregation ATPase